MLNLPQDVITFGRTSDCDVELADKSVSRKHSEIVHEGDDYFLIDLKSGNGTFLNDKKIKPIEKHLLRPGDVIKIEHFEVYFSLLEDLLSRPVEEDTDTDIIEVKMIKKVLRALGKDSAPSLEVLNGSAEGKKIFFTEDLKEVTMGRDPDSTLFIDETVISRHHAKLLHKWGGVVLQDLDSRNGCYVNNEKINEKLLRDGDKVMLGTIKLIYRNPQDVNIEAIGQEISRKKREAALRESELMEIAQRKKEEEEAKLQEESLALEEKNKAALEEEAKAEALSSEQSSSPPQSTGTEDVKNSAETSSAASQSTAAILAKLQAPFEGMSLFEKSLVGVGLFVLMLALIGVVTILFK